MGQYDLDRDMIRAREGKGVGHVWQKGSNDGVAKERSRTEERPAPPRGKRV